ncbi:DUF6226 family protein [Arthrobacter sp. OV608]|uniref:DUF6226 family protein n=1 Tax=Arthrobacter sp. OV608 TaxID=1882768 RepID=UPI003369E6B8
MHPLPDSTAAGKPRYIRPPLPAATYDSGDGRPIPYGEQWGDGGPDPDSYGVDSRPERFAGLRSVALALIEHLAAVYDVEFHKGPAHPRSSYRGPRRAAGCEGDTGGFPELSR